MITNAEFNLVKQQPNLPLCSHTNTAVTPKKVYEFSIPGGRAWWWQCSICCGWHVTIEKLDCQECDEAYFSLYPAYIRAS